jgi:RND family efflux transporter MFP subunit
MAPTNYPYFDIGSLVKKISLASILLYSFTISVHAQTEVSVMPLSDLATYPDRFAPATVISLNQPLLSAQITAQIEHVPVRVGDLVEAGEVLVELDCAEYELGREAAEASLESTEARYELAKSNLERAQTLVINQLISIENLDSSRTELNALSADLKSSRANLNISRLQESRCDIKAPFDALVLDRMASVGQLATPGTPVASILDLQALEISAQIFADDAAQLSDELELQFESNGNSYPVQLNNLVEALNSATRNREARLEFTGQGALPGSSGKIRWQDPRPHLPSSYLVERNGNLGYFVVNRNRAEFIAIEGAQPGRMNPVTEPIDILVVTEGYAGLSDGDSLTTESAE